MPHNRKSRNATLWCLVVVVVAAMAPLWRLCLLGRACLAPDLTVFYYPTAAYFLQCSGADLLWSPETTMGWPFMRSGYWGTFSPLVWGVSWLVRDPVALVNWLMFVPLALFGVLTYAFARSLGLSRAASVLSACAAQLSAWSVNNAKFPQCGAAWCLPALLLCVKYYGRRGRLFAVLCAVIVLLGILMGPPIVFYGIFGTGLFVLVGVIRRHYPARLLFWLVLGVGLGFVMAGVYVLPMTVITACSPRVGAEPFSLSGMTALRALVGLFVTDFHDVPRVTINDEIFTGLAVLALALAAVVAHKRRPGVQAIAILAGAFLLIGLGNATPLRWAVMRVPGLSVLGTATRALFVFSFAIAILAGASLDALATHAKTRRFTRRLAMILLVPVALFWLGCLTLTTTFAAAEDTIKEKAWRHVEGELLGQPEHFRTPEFYRDKVDALFSKYRSRFAAWRKENWASVACLVALLFLLGRLARGRDDGVRPEAADVRPEAADVRPKAADARIKAAIVAVCVLELALVTWDRIRISDRPARFEPNHAAEIIEQDARRRGDAGPYRIFDWYTHHRVAELDDRYDLDARDRTLVRWDFFRESLTPENNLAYGLSQADVTMTLSPKWCHLVGARLGSMRAMVAGKQVSYLWQAGMSPDKAAAHFLAALPLLRVANVRYVVTPLSLVHRDLEPLDERVIAEVASGEPLGIWIYRLRRSLPRAFFATEARVMNDGDAIAYMTSDVFRPDREIILADDVKGAIAPPSPAARDTASPGARITEYSPPRVSIAVDARSAGHLFLGDSFYPEWHAWVNGAPATILRANVFGRAVRLSAGPHRVVFEYRPVTLVRGVGLTVLGALACLVLLVWDRRRKRGQPPSSGSSALSRRKGVCLPPAEKGGCPLSLEQQPPDADNRDASRSATASAPDKPQGPRS